MTKQEYKSLAYISATIGLFILWFVAWFLIGYLAKNAVIAGALEKFF